jgi:hypothetical protein
MSNHTHTAIHVIHRNDKSGKPERIKPGAQFTPADSAQAKYLEENGAARKNPKAEVVADSDGTGKKGGGKKAGKGDGEGGDGDLL